MGTPFWEWAETLDNNAALYRDVTSKIPSYSGYYSPSLMVSYWGQYSSPYAEYLYDGNTFDPLVERKDQQYINDNFKGSLKKENRRVLRDISPLQEAFEKYRKNPIEYNPGDSKYPNKVKAASDELYYYSPEIRQYMKDNNIYAEGGQVDAWNQLSLKDKNDYIGIGVRNGLTDIGEIRSAYNEMQANSYRKGGYVNTNKYSHFMPSQNM